MGIITALGGEMKKVFVVEGMSCAACSSSVERVTRKMKGVSFSEVNLSTGKLTIEFDDKLVSIEDIIKKVERAGFKAHIYTENESIKKEETSLLALVLALVSAFLLLYVCMLPMFFKGFRLPDIIDMHKNPQNNILLQVFLCLVIYFAGAAFLKRGIKALVHLKPNMDSLVTIGSLTAFIYSLVLSLSVNKNPNIIHSLYFESAGVVLALVMLGKKLEARSKDRTHQAINKLMQLAPDVVNIEKDGKIIQINTNEAVIGDIVVIKPGERIALDAVVKSGFSAVDESMLTGESMPVDKEKGDEIFAGSLNKSGLIRAEVKAVGIATRLSSIIRFIQEAQGKKAPIASLADRIAGFFVPAVMGIAILSSLVWLILGKESSFVLNVFVSVLVVACPCAMGLATPTAIVVASGKAANNGILIRNGEALQRLSETKLVLFDKTGTLTYGKLKLSRIYSKGFSEDDFLRLCSSAESASSHPLALAVVDESRRRGIKDLYAVLELSDISGKGIKAKIEGFGDIFVGSERLMRELGVSFDGLSDELKLSENSGESQLFLALNSKLVGFMGFKDELRLETKKTIDELRKEDIKVGIISGDRKAAVSAIADELGLDFFEAEILPEEKAEIVEKYQKMGYKTMMVGDGINDAPALVKADIGLAMGNGTDIAIDAADVILMHDEIMNVKRAIRLSRITIKNIKENLFWAFFYNVLGIPVAAGLLSIFGGPLLSPAFAGVAMSLSSISVVSNALRINMKKLD